MENLDLQLFKKSNDDGSVDRYSLMISLSFDQFGFNLDLPEGPIQGQTSADGTILKINLDAIDCSVPGEIPAWVNHSRTNLREISGLVSQTSVLAIEVEITSAIKGSQNGTIALADADEEEARPIPFISFPQ